MRITRVWLIPTLASLLALGACDARDTTVVELNDGESDVVPQERVAAERAFITGKLGTIDLGDVGQSTLRGRDAMEYAGPAASALERLVAERMNAAGTEELEAVWVRENSMGQVGIRFEQRIDGLPVRGAQLYVSVDKASGMIDRVNGEFVADRGLARTPAIDATPAIDRALLGVGLQASLRGQDIDLVYALDKKDHAILAWQTEVEYTDAAGNPQRDIIFASALDGSLVARHPIHKYARQLETIDCEQKTRCNNTVSTSSNTISTGDAAVDAAHNYAIATYNYYSANHGRDSIDDAGMTLISRVHYNRNYNNAFWDGSQMTYGDGDGSTFIPLSQDADVVAHELTHGVTERSSNLIYQNESGALNEALSDIFGALVDRQEGANVTDTWLLGEDIYTPGTPGDGLRVMNHPSSVGDFDYYPTRYTGTSDNGGVHWNSGIANLAFVLMVQGGSHPAGHNTGTVSALRANFDDSLAVAGDIFYHANTSCLTSGSNFEAARNCTAGAALALFGQAEVDIVHAAWDAVGVPGGPGNEPPPPPPPAECSGSVTVAFHEDGTTISANELRRYTVNVPAGACDLNLSTAGSQGDADLYVKFGQQADPNTFDFASYSPTSNESVNIASPNEGVWHVTVHGYRRSPNLTTNGQYQNP